MNGLVIVHCYFIHFGCFWQVLWSSLSSVGEYISTIAENISFSQRACVINTLARSYPMRYSIEHPPVSGQRLDGFVGNT
jgi:hypothetical protein